MAGFSLNQLLPVVFLVLTLKGYINKLASEVKHNNEDGNYLSPVFINSMRYRFSDSFPYIDNVVEY